MMILSLGSGNVVQWQTGGGTNILLPVGTVLRPAPPTGWIYRLGADGFLTSSSDPGIPPPVIPPPEPLPPLAVGQTIKNTWGTDLWVVISVGSGKILHSDPNITGATQPFSIREGSRVRGVTATGTGEFKLFEAQEWPAESGIVNLVDLGQVPTSGFLPMPTPTPPPAPPVQWQPPRFTEDVEIKPVQPPPVWQPPVRWQPPPTPIPSPEPPPLVEDWEGEVPTHAGISGIPFWAWLAGGGVLLYFISRR